MLQGIRIIKFYAWEGPFAAIVRKARAAEEYPILKHAYWMMMGLQAIFLQLPNLLLLRLVFIHHSIPPLYTPFIHPLYAPINTSNTLYTPYIPTPQPPPPQCFRDPRLDERIYGASRRMGAFF